jgi:hypothetical protein
MSDLQPGSIVPDEDDFGMELNGRVGDDGAITCIRCAEMATEGSTSHVFRTIREWNKHTDVTHRSRKHWRYGNHYQTFS